jgi:amino acid transporter
MDVLSIVALVLLIIMIGLIISLIWFLGGMPGRVAANRNHPNAQAIQVGGWASLFCGIVIWPIVLMWAYSKPARQASATNDADDANDANTHQELAELKVEVARLSALVAKTGGQSL